MMSSVLRVARRMSHQGVAQHEVADGPLGTRVDDALARTHPTRTSATSSRRGSS